MDKETLSNYGWIVICVLVLAVMLAFAGPFGNFIADAVKSTTAGLFGVNQNALGAAGITIDGQGFDGTINGGDPALNPGGVTIENNTYEYGDYIYTRQIISGNELGAQTLEEGQSLLKHYVEQELGMSWEEVLELYAQYDVTEEQLFESYGLTEETFEPTVFGDGWNVQLNLNVTDKNRTSYGPILESINGSSVVSMDFLFQDCKSLAEAPVIPNGIKTMSYAFSGCSSLVTAPVIPNGISDITYAFVYCTNMKTYVGSTDPDGDFSKFKIPSNVTSVAGLFNGCKKMTNVPTIPNKVTNMESAFQGCDLIIAPPVIPNGVTNLKNTFSGCTSLSITPVIPESATDIGGFLWGCSAITVAPIIPSKVTDVHYTFQGCTSLKTYVGSTDPDGDFSDYVIPDGVTTMMATFEGCINLTHAPVIPENVSNLYSTFFGCKSLTGVVVINTNKNFYREYGFVSGTTMGTSSDDEGVYGNCFHGVDMRNITLTGSASKNTLNLLGGTGYYWTPIS